MKIYDVLKQLLVRDDLLRCGIAICQEDIDELNKLSTDKLVFGQTSKQKYTNIESVEKDGIKKLKRYKIHVTNELINKIKENCTGEEKKRIDNLLESQGQVRNHTVNTVDVITDEDGNNIININIHQKQLLHSYGMHKSQENVGSNIIGKIPIIDDVKKTQLIREKRIVCGAFKNIRLHGYCASIGDNSVYTTETLIIKDGLYYIYRKGIECQYSRNVIDDIIDHGGKVYLEHIGERFGKGILYKATIVYPYYKYKLDDIQNFMETECKNEIIDINQKEQLILDILDAIMKETCKYNDSLEENIDYKIEDFGIKLGKHRKLIIDSLDKDLYFKPEDINAGTPAYFNPFTFNCYMNIHTIPYINQLYIKCKILILTLFLSFGFVTKDELDKRIASIIVDYDESNKEYIVYINGDNCKPIKTIIISNVSNERCCIMNCANINNTKIEINNQELCKLIQGFCSIMNRFFTPKKNTDHKAEHNGLFTKANELYRDWHKDENKFIKEHNLLNYRFLEKEYKYDKSKKIEEINNTLFSIKYILHNDISLCEYKCKKKEIKYLSLSNSDLIQKYSVKEISQIYNEILDIYQSILTYRENENNKLIGIESIKSDLPIKENEKYKNKILPIIYDKNSLLKLELKELYVLAIRNEKNIVIKRKIDIMYQNYNRENNNPVSRRNNIAILENELNILINRIRIVSKQKYGKDVLGKFDRFISFFRGMKYKFKTTINNVKQIENSSYLHNKCIFDPNSKLNIWNVDNKYKDEQFKLKKDIVVYETT